MTYIEELNDAFPVFNEDLDTSFLLELMYYFPIEKTRISTGSYDPYLYDLEKTVIDNYGAGNYQVVYFHAHLIFMSYAYYCIESAYSLWPDKVKDQYDLLNAYSSRNKPKIYDHNHNTYAFSKIPEKEIFKVFYAIGLDVQFIQQLSSYVEKRNDYAHATGEGNINVETLISNITTIKKNMDKIFSLFTPHLKQIYKDFLLDSYATPQADLESKIADYIDDQSFSVNDLHSLCNLGISNFRNEDKDFSDNYRHIKNVHNAFKRYCAEQYEIDVSYEE